MAPGLVSTFLAPHSMPPQIGAEMDDSPSALTQDVETITSNLPDHPLWQDYSRIEEEAPTADAQKFLDEIKFEAGAQGLPAIWQTLLGFSTLSRWSISCDQ